ncbi:protein-tyrosine-phosphatase [Coemansia erecta]|uniref:Protein-tyrosine-phosphatase n=1 Tax=Coemansia asiatica TaxID=1052880 RepID=A0A9W8CIG3_9FUNG|nr:protein-tyrosine-phosphatase [Coemansia asiatica]KAJ2856509.1 protein-tyrosine-phosphatase [Coemansia erecta]KAJ2888603.1 protein-tyrosine-phosphatase [Coemansia asiatica]
MADIVDPLIPPYRFERVQNYLYRGGYPKPRNYRFLRRQQLKTILSLIPSSQDEKLVEFCKDSNINLLTIKVQSPKENVTVTRATVSQCLELLTDPAHAPLYLHCLDGSNVTGVVIMCLRKLQLWRVASYQNEYLRFEQDGEIIPEESEFVEAYDGEGLVLANPYAQWLWPSRDSIDVNVLPFERGVHPVIPLVRLRQRMSTDICVADPLCSLSRSATDPALNANNNNTTHTTEVAFTATAAAAPEASTNIADTGIDIDIVKGAAGTGFAGDAHVSAPVPSADSAGSVNPRHHLVMARRTISDSQHTQPSLDIAPQILTSSARSVRFSGPQPIGNSFEGIPATRVLLMQQTHRRTQSIDKQGATSAQHLDEDGTSARTSLHTSLSTGALNKAISGSAQTESDSQTLTGQAASGTEHKKALDDIHEALEPVLAALAKTSEAASSRSAAGSSLSEPPSKDGARTGASRSSELSLASASASAAAVGISNAVPVSLPMPAVFSASDRQDASLYAVGANDTAEAKIREIPLSYAVKALAIEGLGM